MPNNQYIPAPLTHELLFKDNFISIYYNFENNWIYSDWHGNHTSETLIAASEMMLTCAHLKKAHKILNNSINLNYAWEELINWVTNDYVPRLEEAGVEYFAWIYSDKNISSKSADTVLKTHTANIITIVFDKVETGEKWLRSIH